MVERQQVIGKIQSAVLVKSPGLEAESEEITLRQSLDGKKLTSQQNTVVLVLDGMRISFSNKRLIFFYDMWRRNPSYGPIKEFGDIREDPTIDSMLDKVMDDDNLGKEFDDFDRRYNYLSKNPLAIRIWNLKKDKLSHKQISDKIRHPKKEVDKISQDLVFLGIIKPIHANNLSDDFRSFAFKVLDLRQKGLIDFNEIAKLLNADRRSIVEAVLRLKRVGLIKPMTKTELGKIKRDKKKEITQKIKYYRNTSKLTAEEIAVTIGVSLWKVESEIKILIREKQIQPR